jgi:hypothetical protein
MVQGRIRWDQALETVPKDRMLEPVFEGGWSMKDVIAHIGEWEGVAASRLAFALGEVATGPEFEDIEIDERNQRYFERNRERPLEAVTGQEVTNWERLRAVTESMSEEQLNDDELVKSRPGHAPWDIIAGNAHEHFDEHIEQIHSWLASEEA